MFYLNKYSWEQNYHYSTTAVQRGIVSMQYLCRRGARMHTISACVLRLRRKKKERKKTIRDIYCIRAFVHHSIHSKPRCMGIPCTVKFYSILYSVSTSPRARYSSQQRAHVRPDIQQLCAHPQTFPPVELKPKCRRELQPQVMKAAKPDDEE